MIDYPEVGPRKSYLIYHEEVESLVENIRGLKQIRFWMTFSDNYLKHLEVLQNVGMTRIDPVEYKGKPIIPMEFLKALLPPPASLGENYTGKTSIGCIFKGMKDGKQKRVLHLQHLRPRRDLQGGRRAGRLLHDRRAAGGRRDDAVQGQWRGAGVFNIEQLPSKPFMDEIGKQGLPWHCKEISEADQADLFKVKT